MQGLRRAGEQRSCVRVSVQAQFWGVGFRGLEHLVIVFLPSYHEQREHSIWYR